MLEAYLHKIHYLEILARLQQQEVHYSMRLKMCQQPYLEILLRHHYQLQIYLGIFSSLNLMDLEILNKQHLILLEVDWLKLLLQWHLDNLKVQLWIRIHLDNRIIREEAYLDQEWILDRDQDHYLLRYQNHSFQLLIHSVPLQNKVMMMVCFSKEVARNLQLKGNESLIRLIIINDFE